MKAQSCPWLPCLHCLDHILRSTLPAAPPPDNSQPCRGNGNEQMHKMREGAAVSNSYENAWCLLRSHWAWRPGRTSEAAWQPAQTRKVRICGGYVQSQDTF